MFSYAHTPSSREQDTLCSRTELDSFRIFLVFSDVFYVCFIIIFQGYLVFKDFCETQCDEPVPQLAFYEDVSERAFIPYINLFIYLYIFPDSVQEAPRQPWVE